MSTDSITSLENEILDRLEVAQLTEAVKTTAMAAVIGELESHLDGASVDPPAKLEQADQEPVGAYLSSITVEGFRGIGPEARIEFENGPGLTLVVGRNGSGKSSLAEALELLLTGENSRWSDGRQKRWADGWRNLHEGSRVRLSAQLNLDGVGQVTASRRWSGDEPLASGEVNFSAQSGVTSLAELGWTDALSVHRPFLSYNELGSLLEQGPSKLHDSMALILGLGELDAMREEVDTHRKQLEDEVKEVQSQGKALVHDLEQLDDDRARESVDAIGGRTWELDRLTTVLEREGVTEGAAAVVLLQQVVGIESPDFDSLMQKIDALALAEEHASTVVATDAGRSLKLAELLEMAIGHCAHDESSACPVCGSPETIDQAWVEDAESQVVRLREESTSAQSAISAARSARSDVLRTLAGPPKLLLEVETTTGLSGVELHEAWTALSAPPSGMPQGAGELRDHVAAYAPLVGAPMDRLRGQALAALELADAQWRAVAARLGVWLGAATTAEHQQEIAENLKAAKKWLDDTAIAMRNERFEPVLEQVQAHWERMRARSNVEICDVAFTGRGSSRRLNLNVEVDDANTDAISVMSQGELHSLALCLFLPRATAKQSPFRFMVIDDPVQAMDPSRVDGLASVLADVAAQRQVIVFTHDDRLPESCRRLGLDHRAVEVHRQHGSVVTLREVTNPVEQYLEDARAFARTENIDSRLLGRVLPTLCRQSIEARCVEIIRRRELKAGDHEAVEQLLEDADGFMKLLALALFGDLAKMGGVYRSVEGRLDESWGGQHLKLCNRGAHEGLDDDPKEFVRRTEQIVKCLN